MFCAADKHTTPVLCEWIWSNAVGQVLEVHNWTTRPFRPQGMTDYPSGNPPIPDGFNWRLWQGPVTERPHHPAYTHARFRGFGTIAQRIEGKLLWDTDAMRFINNEKANDLIYRTYRPGWELI